MKIALTNRMQPIVTKMPPSTLVRNPASILPKAFLPLDPSILEGLDQEGIDKLVPAFALKATAVDGGPKWSWVDVWGIHWEVRFHPHANITFPSWPSGCGSTSALTTVEYEPGLVQDLRRLFDEIVPANRPYAHDAAWGDGNGHSHVRAALLGPSLTVPFVETRLTLGTWQQIIYLDFDNRSRQRKLVVQMIGE